MVISPSMTSHPTKLSGRSQGDQTAQTRASLSISTNADSCPRMSSFAPFHCSSYGNVMSHVASLICTQFIAHSTLVMCFRTLIAADV